MVVASSKTKPQKFSVDESSVTDYFYLLKPRVMTLAVFTSFCGLYLAPGYIHPFLALVSILCISMGAGSCAAINMWYDKDIDSVMDRTKNRAIPQGKIDSDNVLGFGILLGILSLIIMGLAINYLAAFLLAFSIFFYIVIYTFWLKRSTHHNIVIGGAAGAFPPVIGWACVSNDISLYPLMLFSIIFIWTPPHFWALALYKDTEYSKVNIPMLPVKFGKKITKIQIFIYSLLLSIISTAPYFFELTSIFFLFSSFALNSVFLFFSFKLLASDKPKEDLYASRLFKYSIIYLYLIFIFFVFDKALFYYG